MEIGPVWLTCSLTDTIPTALPHLPEIVPRSVYIGTRGQRDHMIDFSIPSELEATRDRVAAFMQQHVYPNESKMVEDEGLPVDLESDLQGEVKAQGLWAPNLPREWGGMGIGFIGQALVNEIIGRSIIAPRIFGSAAPDAGNAELLLIAATPEQQERYLRPLAAGDVRSCFAMTEPEAAGSDP